MSRGRGVTIPGDIVGGGYDGVGGGRMVLN